MLARSLALLALPSFCRTIGLAAPSKCFSTSEIFVRGQCLGGCDDLLAIEQQGSLKQVCTLGIFCLLFVGSRLSRARRVQGHVYRNFKLILSMGVIILCLIAGLNQLGLVITWFTDSKQSVRPVLYLFAAP